MTHVVLFGNAFISPGISFFIIIFHPLAILIEFKEVSRALAYLLINIPGIFPFVAFIRTAASYVAG
jgi:hypothetical protein